MILDTWPHYRNAVTGHLDSPTELLDAWHDRYLSRWPSLRRRCLQSYEEEGESWRKLAAKWIYPVVRDQQSRMARAHTNLLAIIPQVDERYCALVRKAPRIRYVILVDIGFAGWASHYRGSRAVLLGLAQIARLGWHRQRSLRDLIAHELAHQVHSIWRRRARQQELTEDAVGRLYSEGFAQRVGHLLGGEEWQQAARTWPNWLQRCRRQSPALAAKYLRAIRRGGSVRAFFGDWFEMDGLSMTGYYLGHEFIRSLEDSGLSVERIAALGREGLHERAEEFLISAGRPRV